MRHDVLNVHPSARAEIQRDTAWRRERIATAAYYLAEHRGSAPSDQEENWLLAEAQIDALDEFHG